MHTGMLWFDDGQKTTLEQKVIKAVSYYEKKYGRTPDLCLVHPSMMEGQKLPENVTVRPYRPVLPGHIWIGVEDNDGEKGSS